MMRADGAQEDSVRVDAAIDEPPITGDVDAAKAAIFTGERMIVEQWMKFFPHKQRKAFFGMYEYRTINLFRLPHKYPITDNQHIL